MDIFVILKNISKRTKTAFTLSKGNATSLVTMNNRVSALERQDVNTKDYVVEQGTSGIWTYRKWSSGIAECWADTTVTVTSWTLWGNQYQGSFSQQYFAYPSELFVSTPQLLVSCYPPATGGFGTSGVELWTDANHNHTKDATPYIYPLRPQTPSAPTGNAPIIISMQAKSRWK